MALRHSHKLKTAQSRLWRFTRLGLPCLAALIAFAGVGCVNDDATDLDAERSADQCELENNRRASDFYKQTPGKYATTMTAGAALNIHTECSVDSAYSWEPPY